MCVCVHVYFYFSGKYLGVELLDYKVVYMLKFIKKTSSFLKWLKHFIFPPAMYEESSYSTSSSTLGHCQSFNFSHPSGCEVVSILF